MNKHAQDSISKQLGTSGHRPVGVLAEIHEEARFPTAVKNDNHRGWAPVDLEHENCVRGCFPRAARFPYMLQL